MDKQLPLPGLNPDDKTPKGGDSLIARIKLGQMIMTGTRDFRLTIKDTFRIVLGHRN